MGLFDFGSAKMKSTLKNPNELREAFVYNELSQLPKSKIKEFIRSKEAKVMTEEGIISLDMIEKLSKEAGFGSELEIAVCQLAKESDDPQWQELVSARIEERRLLNDLFTKYGDKAEGLAENAKTDFIKKCVPKYFQAE